MLDNECNYKKNILHVLKASLSQEHNMYGSMSTVDNVCSWQSHSYVRLRSDGGVIQLSVPCAASDTVYPELSWC